MRERAASDAEQLVPEDHHETAAMAPPVAGDAEAWDGTGDEEAEAPLSPEPAAVEP